MAFYDNTGHRPIPVQQQRLTKHIQSMLLPTSHLLPQPRPVKFHKSYENMHTMNLLRDWAKTVPTTIIHSVSSVYPVLRIIYELQSSQAEKPSYMTCSLLKWTSRKIRGGNITQVH